MGVIDYGKNLEAVYRALYSTTFNSPLHYMHYAQLCEFFPISHVWRSDVRSIIYLMYYRSIIVIMQCKVHKIALLTNKQ